MKTLLATGAAIAALTLAGAASAGVSIAAGQNGGTGVHSTAGLSAPTVTGTAGSDLVTLSTVGDKLDTSGGGESKYAAHDGLMDDLSILFTFDYDAVTFNLNTPNSGTTAFTVVVNGGLATFTETGLANGQNKYTITATGTDFIHSLDFTFTGALVNDIRQIRVGDLVTPNGGGGGGGGGNGGGVPEPATWAMMLVGFGGVGAMMRRRKLQGATAA
jgi:hypothetical protein